MRSLLPEDEIPERGSLHVDVPVSVICVTAEFSTRKAHRSRTTTINMQICNGNCTSLP